MPSSVRAGGRILVVDVGGTHVKASFSHRPNRRLRFPSGPTMTPVEMVRQIRQALGGERFDRVSIGYPGLVRRGTIVREPFHLGKGWVGFDFTRAFRRPTRVLNDAAMQALGSYRGGSMLFLGLGSGLGSAMIVDGVLLPMELAHLPYRKGRTFEEYVGEDARRHEGRRRWQKEVFAVIDTLEAALEPDYVVVGGGNVRKLRRLPPGAHRGDNRNAFLGGIRAWQTPAGRSRGSGIDLGKPPARSSPGRKARGS
ncbi:MAG TPA: ROK family protein [Thermoplasmata archaeon]|nr:ROK family protein [Thermoplasmata archaeon]